MCADGYKHWHTRFLRDFPESGVQDALLRAAYRGGIHHLRDALYSLLGSLDGETDHDRVEAVLDLLDTYEEE